MLKLICATLICLAFAAAINLPPEPKLPSKVCTELKADLKTQSEGHLSESDESKTDTKRIKEALDKCKAGEAVKLVKGGGNAFLSGHIELPSGVTLWIDAGVTLFASRNPRDFDKESKSCGVLSSGGSGCLPLISVKNTKNSAIVGDGIIDGRGGQKMHGSTESWWELALRAQKEKTDESCLRLIIVEKSEDFVLYRVRLHNSPNFHFITNEVTGLVVWGVKVETPTSAYPAGTHARNTDAFDPNGKNMVFTQCYISTGDDNIAIKGGKALVSNVLIQDNHFYRGHGMSIGSETNAGVVNVTVKNLSIDGADNGLRIKSDASKGGSVSGIHYENICIRNTDSPLVFDSYYSDKKGSKYPNFHDIHVMNTHILSSNKKEVVFRGYDEKFPLKITLDNVVSDVELTKVVASNAEITEGPGEVKGIAVKVTSGKNVKVTGHPGKSSPIDCSKMFVPFPK